MVKISPSILTKKTYRCGIVGFCCQSFRFMKTKGDRLPIYLDSRTVFLGLSMKVKSLQRLRPSRSSGLKIIPLRAYSKVLSTIIERVSIYVINNKSSGAIKDLTMKVAFFSGMFFRRSSSADNVSMRISTPSESGYIGCVHLIDDSKPDDQVLPILQRYFHIAPIIT